MRRDRRKEPCRIVILDSQNVRGAPVHVLANLRARGLRLHVSAISLEEVWAQAVRERRLSLITSRVPKLAPYVDEAEPVKTAGVDLVRRLGGTVQAPLVLGEVVTPEHLTSLWRGLASGSLDDAWITRGGAMIEQAAQERGADWLSTVGLAANVPAWGDDSTASEQEVARQVAHQFFEAFGPVMSVPGGMHERFEGYYRCAGLHAARARRRTQGKLKKPDENDAEDLQLLMHLAEGAFLATNDLNLIEHVDQSGSFQAPWVRTIGELLTIELPEGNPWGRSARRALATHRRRSRIELRDLEERVRAHPS